MKKLTLLLLLYLISSKAQTVNRIVLDGVINPAATEYIIKNIEQAEKERVSALLIELDTPGGLMESMHRIVKAIQGSDVPVIVYVYPDGARAASAGLFITYAAHVAAMAPSTNIGSAHPVFSGGAGMPTDSSGSETMMEKVTNDAVAKIKAMAEKRSRNVQWAEKAIVKSENITAREALKMKVIDYIAPNADSLLCLIDGKEITLDNGKHEILHTRNAEIVTYEMSWRQRLLDLISNPNIAYILMMIGIYGLMFELYNPGSVLPGVLGAISLILGLYAMQTLPVNYAGFLLIIFAIIMFLLEIKIPSYGLLTIGGIVSLIMGTVMLFDTPFPFLRVSWQVIAGVTVITVLFVIFVIGMALKIQRKKPVTGAEGMIGEIGIAAEKINPEGRVKIHGEIWKAYSDETINKGRKITVISCDDKNLVIKVKERT